MNKMSSFSLRNSRFTRLNAIKSSYFLNAWSFELTAKFENVSGSISSRVIISSALYPRSYNSSANAMRLEYEHPARPLCADCADSNNDLNFSRRPVLSFLKSRVCSKLYRYKLIATEDAPTDDDDDDGCAHATNAGSVEMMSGIYTSQNRDRIGLSSLFLSSTTIKKRVEWQNSSMHRRSADCASIVSLSAFNRTIDLNRSPSIKSTFVFAKNFRSSRINRMPRPYAQFTFMI